MPANRNVQGLGRVRTLGREGSPERSEGPRPRVEEPQPSSESSHETTRLSRLNRLENPTSTLVRRRVVSAAASSAATYYYYLGS